MQSESVVQVPERIPERFGIFPSRDGPDGKRVGSVIKIDMTVKTNDSKEMLLSYVDVLRDLIKESIEENYDAFVADTDPSKLPL